MIPLDAMPVPLANGKGFAWVDVVDVEAVGAWSWCPHQGKTSRTPYAHATVNNCTVSLHRFIAERAGLQARQHVDHIDRDGLNCTRGNLRAATPSQNHGNERRSRNNTSGYKGVTHSCAKRRLTWCAQITIHRKRLYLGSFDTRESAARVYDAWAREAFGEFAALNFPEAWQ